MNPRSPILAFYDGSGTDAAGRTIAEIWAWDHRRLEMVHDYIQWLFPLPEPSRFNPDAPILSTTDMSAFQRDAGLQARVHRSLDVMLDFLGLGRKEGVVIRSTRFTPALDWLSPANHNHLRLTRILLFLKHAGLKRDAEALLACLDDIASQEGAEKILPQTLKFWRDALR